jgi:hypothetical protein
MKHTFLTGFFALSLAMGISAGQSIPDTHKIAGFAVGLQAYTFNRFTVFEAIEKTDQAGGKVIEFYPGQPLSRMNAPSVGATTHPTMSSRR